MATSTYRYDGLGRRIEKVGNGQTRRYVYDGEDILLEYDGTNMLLARYTHGPGIDEPLAMTRGASTFFYHQDGLGTVTELTDSAGATAKSYAYDAWGNVIEQIGTVENPYTYTGREVDAETGLYYYRARYYDPTIGRFLQRDPIELAGGDPNLYGYVGNSPLNWSDPLGLKGGPENLGLGWTGRVDPVPGTKTFEIHVFNPGGQEVGIVQGTNGWIAKHGHSATRPPGMPNEVVNKLNGLNVKELRARCEIGAKGTQNIRGMRYLKAGRVLGVAGNAISIADGILEDVETVKQAQQNGRTFSDQVKQNIINSGNPDIILTPFGPIPNPYATGPES